MKRIIYIFLGVLFLFIMAIMVVTYNNDKYVINIKKDIVNNNSDIKLSSIDKVNKYKEYYIISNSHKIFVLDDKYNEVISYNTSSLYKEALNHDIIYDGNILYVISKVLDNSVVYEYYDVFSGEVVSSLKVGR